MDILEHIKTERAQQKRKQDFRPCLVDKISALVKEHGLGEVFLQQLEGADNYVSRKHSHIARIRTKRLFEFPPFCLATRQQYDLAKAIISKVDNPYLQFAQSPEEVCLSNPLFNLNPSLSPNMLDHYHFETLLVYESAKEDLQELSARATNLRKKKGEGAADELSDDDQSVLEDTEKRIRKLQTFIAEVESTSA